MRSFEIVFPGANFHPSLTRPKKSQVIQKGTNPLIDAYSAFFDNTDIKGSGDTGLRRLVRDSTEIVVVGLAQDYCVAWTALDSLEVSQRPYICIKCGIHKLYVCACTLMLTLRSICDISELLSPLSNPCSLLQVLGLPTTILADHTRPVDPRKGEVMMEAVREAGGIVTNLGDYLDELDEWSKAKEIARFLIQNSSVSINSSSSVISIALSFMLYSLLSQ